MNISLALILPAGLQKAGNDLAEVLGYGPETYSVALSPTGQEPATHYGAHTWASQAFLDALAAASSGVVPPGADPAAVQSVIGQLVAHPLETDVVADGLPHFLDVVASHGLRVVTPPIAPMLPTP